MSPMPDRPARRAHPAIGETVVHAAALRRTFGDVVALEGADVTVRPGELIGLLGPNGAGKTTFLSLVMGLRRPTSGRVEVLGGDPRQPATRVRIGVTPQQTGLPETLRTREVIDFVASHYPDPMPRDELLERFGLGEVVAKQAGALSGGQQRRLAVALAFVGRPDLVLLDEPTTGLDVSARSALWAAIREYHGEGGTVLLTSHYLEEVQALAERVVVVDHGRILADDSLPAVLARVAMRHVSLETTDERAEHLDGVVSHTRDGARLDLLTDDADALVREVVTSGIDFRGLEVRGASLEEAFAEMIEKEAAA